MDLHARDRPVETARWVVPVALPIVAVLVLHAVIAPAGLPEALRTVGVGALWGGALVIGPVVLVVVAIAVTSLTPAGRARRLAGSQATWIAGTVVAYFVLLTSVGGRIAPLPFFDVFERHWQGKILDLLWVVILFAMFRRWARDEAGVTWRIRHGSLVPAVITIGGVFVLFAGLAMLTVALDPSSRSAVSLEQLAYDATIPNLTEELIWRAAMLAVLDRAFGTPKEVLGAKVGWGLVITAALFGLGHTILVDLDTGAWSVSLAGGVFATVMGVALAWIWARTGSVWPAFLLHCAPELGVDVGMLILR
jgi:membrane protease YdiL (CAAX protease family)